MLKIVSFFASLSLLTGCATRYHQAGFIGGGYSDFRISQDTFAINFKGNAFTSSQDVMKYSLMRASELTIQNGYRYFTITSVQDITKRSLFFNSQSNADSKAFVFANSGTYTGSSSSSASLQEIEKPGLEFSIKCYKWKPDDLEVIDAEEYLAYNPIQ